MTSSNGTNKNGIKEVLSCQYLQNSNMSIDLRLFNSSDDADKWYELENKYEKNKVEEKQLNDGKYFISKLSDGKETMTRIGIRRGNLLLLILEFSKDKSEINTVLKIIGDALSQIS